MRYFELIDGVLQEYFGVVKSNQEMSEFLTYNGSEEVKYLKVDLMGKVIRKTPEEIAEVDAFKPQEHVYSKYKVKKELSLLIKNDENMTNYWDFVKNSLSESQWEDLVLAQDLSFADESFYTICCALAIDGVDVNEILKKSILK